MTGTELLRLQLALECKALTTGRLLVRVAGDEPDDIPLASVVKLAQTHVLAVRGDVDGDVRERVHALDAAEAFARPGLVVDVLLPVRGELTLTAGTSYVFDERPDAPADVVPLGDADTGVLTGELGHGFRRFLALRPVHAVIEDGYAVAACTSSRENTAAAEAWVMTTPSRRRDGLARRVVSAWARDVMDAGKTAFYSHRVDNDASRGVAHSLGARWWSDFFAFR